MSKKLRKIILSIFSILLLFLQGCKSTKAIERDFFETEDHYIFARNINFSDDLGDNYKYIFFRLYNPEYKNPLYIANLLKGGIAITKTDDLPELSHSSINFSLDDNYYGLTFGGKYQLAPEECQHPKDNKYMRNCDPTKSEQITYALKVTPEEYENTKKFIEKYAASTKLKYNSFEAVKLAVFFIQQKFFTPSKYQKFGNRKYPFYSKKNRKVDLDKDKPENSFICSNFLGYVLYNNVESVSEYFDEHDIKYDYLNVTDLALIPGMVPLFYSNWDDYVETAKAFVEEYPEFKDYLTNTN